MMMSDDKVGGWVKKGQNHDDVILEWSLKGKSRMDHIQDVQADQNRTPHDQWHAKLPL